MIISAFLGGIGWKEVLVILLVALVLFGARRLPELGRSLGKSIREFRKSIKGDDAAAKTTEGDPPVDETPE